MNNQQKETIYFMLCVRDGCIIVKDDKDYEILGNNLKENGVKSNFESWNRISNNTIDSLIKKDYISEVKNVIVPTKKLKDFLNSKPEILNNLSPGNIQYPPYKIIEIEREKQLKKKAIEIVKNLTPEEKVIMAQIQKSNFVMIYKNNMREVGFDRKAFIENIPSSSVKELDAIMRISVANINNLNDNLLLNITNKQVRGSGTQIKWRNVKIEPSKMGKYVAELCKIDRKLVEQLVENYDKVIENREKIASSPKPGR